MEQILKFIATYGYLFIFCVLFAENTVFVGLVMPGETVLFAGAFAASAGYLNIFIVFIVACLAAILGNIGGYLIGYYGGRNILEKYGKKFSVSKLLEESEDYFKKHGNKTVFVGRFAAGIRVFVAVLAGTSKMDFDLFFFYTVASVVLWTLGVTLLGYFFGSQYKLILLISRRFSIILLVIIVILITLFIWRRNYGKKQNPGKLKE